MIQQLRFLTVLLLLAGFMGCSNSDTSKKEGADKDTPKLVKKRRDDGTLSSVNPVDEEGYVHGVKTNYYEDGKTIHSRVSYSHGRKHGPALWYYKNGQTHEHTGFHYGKKQGLTKKYYKTGELLEELTYEQGDVVPGSKKKYSRSGERMPD